MLFSNSQLVMVPKKITENGQVIVILQGILKCNKRQGVLMHTRPRKSEHPELN